MYFGGRNPLVGSFFQEKLEKISVVIVAHKVNYEWVIKVALWNPVFKICTEAVKILGPSVKLFYLPQNVIVYDTIYKTAKGFCEIFDQVLAVSLRSAACCWSACLQLHSAPLAGTALSRVWLVDFGWWKYRLVWRLVTVCLLYLLLLLFYLALNIHNIVATKMAFFFNCCFWTFAQVSVLRTRCLLSLCSNRWSDDTVHGTETVSYSENTVLDGYL